MDFHKLKLETFQTYNGFKLPNEFKPPLELSDHPQVYFLFVSSISETMEALNLVQNNQQHKNNRLFFIYKKSNKEFHRDHLYNVVMRHPNIKRKAPVLASLNKTYSVFSFMLEL